MKYRNNPLNIRYNERNKWRGQIMPKNGFCQFNSIFSGFRAAVCLVKRYKLYGKETIRQIISRWAPPSDNNNTETYINVVCKNMDCADSKKIITHSDYFNLLHYMTLVEIGEWNNTFEDALDTALDYEGIR